MALNQDSIWGMGPSGDCSFLWDVSREAGTMRAVLRKVGSEGQRFMV